jgi:predicted negative regulator of RcsB-dependent stress response
MSHPAFKVFDSEQGDQNGFPSTVYQVAITKAVDQKKVPIEKRKMPDFKSEEEANRYFKVRI